MFIALIAFFFVVGWIFRPGFFGSISELSWAASHIWFFIFMFINGRKDSNLVHAPTLVEKEIIRAKS